MNSIRYLHKKNSIYEVKDCPPFILLNREKKYLLFNQVLHYWIVLDEISYEIYCLIGKLNDLELVKKEIINKYNINEDIYRCDVIPIISEMEKDGFLTERSEEETYWTDSNLKDSDINYQLNTIYVSISDICNLDCVYCFNKEKRKDRISNKEKSEISIDSITSILHEYKEIGGTGVVFTGGEPTLNKRLIELCKEAKLIGLKTNVITNGTLLYKMDLEALCKYADTISISFDSVINEELKYLWNSNVNDNSEKIMEALKKIDNYAKEKSINIQIMPIVTKANIENQWLLFQKITEVLQNSNISWRVTKYEKINQDIDDELDIDENEYIRSLSRNMKKAYHIENEDSAKIHQIDYFAHTHSGLLRPHSKPRFLRCRPSFFISFNGDVYPCQHCENQDYKLGNIKTDHLVDMYKSSVFQSVISDLNIDKIKVCKDCELRYVCTNITPYCIKNKLNDGIKCKETMIQRLYLTTFKQESD